MTTTLLAILDLCKPAGRKAYGEKLQRLAGTSSSASDAAKTVSQIIRDVAQQGDQALVRYMRQWTDPDFSAKRIAVTKSELNRALKSLDPKLKNAIGQSIANVEKYQKHLLPKPVKPVKVCGAELGLRFTAVDRVGLAVPGGTAVLFSSVIMLAVPAIVAGVDPKNISVVTPPPTRQTGNDAGNEGGGGMGDISPIVLATCAMLGIEKVYRIGGAQAMAALAYGTPSVPKVDLIAGPGNVFVQLAKSQLNGIVGTDNGFYGPSEILTIADESADPACIASDLIAQAEHNPGKCFLVSWKKAVLERIVDEVMKQKGQRNRLAAIDSALQKESAILLVKNEAQAETIANEIAAEHVNLAVKNPDAWLQRIRHGGEFFLGHQTPVAAGDYYAGPSHCLPTGTTARFASGVSVYTFLKRSGTVGYRQGMSAETAHAIALLAEAEGLDGHAQSTRIRLKLKR